MRIKINYSKNTSDVSIYNQSLLNSYIHKCIGINNKYHNTKSDYNISHLYGGKLNKVNNTLEFKNGGYFVVSSNDGELVNKVLVGILNNQELFSGMKFSGVDYVEEQFYNGWNHFATLSPILIKQGGGFLKLTSDDFEIKVQSYLINKLSKINSKLDLSDFKVKIPKHHTHKVKKVLVKNVINLANQCQISIHTNKKVAKLLYNIGVGQSTGSGFGTVYKTENRKQYIIHNN